MYVALSLMDKWWYEDMDEEAGMKLLHKCIDEVQTREFGHTSLDETSLTSGMVIKFDFNCILINKEGIHSIDLSSATPLAGVVKSSTETAAPTAVGVSA